MQIRLYHREEGSIALGDISARLLKHTLLYHGLDYVVQYSTHVIVAVCPQRVGLRVLGVYLIHYKLIIKYKETLINVTVG